MTAGVSAHMRTGSRETVVCVCACVHHLVPVTRRGSVLCRLYIFFAAGCGTPYNRDLQYVM